MKFRDPFDAAENREISDLTGLFCKDESRTQQSQAADADINTIVRRFGITGQLPQTFKLPEYADFDGPFDYQEAQNALIEARESFMQVPAEIRAKFDNDAIRFVEFCADEKNLPALREMGLAKALPPEPEPVKPA